MAKKSGAAFKKGKKGIGDPILTEELIKSVCMYLERGAYIETAVVMAGLSKASFYRWMKESHTKKRTKHVVLTREFRNAVSKSMETATMRDIMTIDKCSQGSPAEYLKYEEGAEDEDGNDISGQYVLEKGKAVVVKAELPPNWNAAAWRLSKRAPKDWGDTVKHIHEKPNIDEHVSEQDNKERMLIQFVDAPEEK